VALGERHLAGIDRPFERPARGGDVARAVVVAEGDWSTPDALELVVLQDDPVLRVGDRHSERQLRDHRV
jgi:hypothetical protein